MIRGLMLTLGVVLAAAGCDKTQRPSSPNATNPPPANTPKDNTAVNERDRADTVKTPIDQNENQQDIDVTANIRKRVVDTKLLSVNAQNVKIITQNGKVTLRGPVKTGEEKQQIEQIATDVAGAGNVDSQLEVQP